MTSAVAKLTASLTVTLAALTALQATGVVTGNGAALLTAAVGVGTAILGAITHKRVNAQLRRARNGGVGR